MLLGGGTSFATGPYLQDVFTTQENILLGRATEKLLLGCATGRVKLLLGGGYWVATGRPGARSGDTDKVGLDGPLLNTAYGGFSGFHST